MSQIEKLVWPAEDKLERGSRRSEWVKDTDGEWVNGATGMAIRDSRCVE